MKTKAKEARVLTSVAALFKFLSLWGKKELTTICWVPIMEQSLRSTLT